MITLRRFSFDDIPLKVRWINDSENNRYLHYDLPLEESTTFRWFEKNKELQSRMDMTILYEGKPVGIIGLLDIDRRKRSAELYVTIGEVGYKGRGIAGAAMEQLLRIAYGELGLHRVFLLTETENESAIRAYTKFGFVKEGVLRDEKVNRDGFFVSSCIFSMLKEEFEAYYGSH